MAPRVLIALMVCVVWLLSSASADAATACRHAARGHAAAHRRPPRKHTRTQHKRARRCAPARPPAAAARPSRPFAPTSFWNAPLSSDAPLDPLSNTYVADLRRQVVQDGSYVNTTRYSAPIYEVPAGQPLVHVTVDGWHPGLREALAEVPIPPDAQPAAGTDGAMVVWQRSSDTMWEFWRAARRVDGWHTAYGGRMTGVSTSPGYFTDPPQWGATATSLPWLGGLMRLDEIRAGRIDHALTLGIPDRRARVWSWPAQRTDGNVDSPLAIPEGARFRIDPAVDLDRIPMAPIVRVMAEAVQRYGMVVGDGAGAVAFCAEDPTPTGTNPFLGPTGYFGGRYISQLLTQFPWAHLQALRTSLRTKWPRP